MQRWVMTCLAGLLASALLLACGGGPDRTKANLRFVNASGYAALDLLVDGDKRFAAVPYGEAAQYAEVDPDNADSVIARAGSSTPLLSPTPALNEKNHYTLLAYGAEGALKSLLLDDNASTEKNKVRLRVLNAAADAGKLDVYLTGANDALATAVALQAGAEVDAVGNFSTLEAATWRLRITGAGDKADLRLDVSGVVLTAEQVVTLVVTPTSGGVLVGALLATQEGSITAVTSAGARVRVAAASRGIVNAAVGGTTLLNNVDSPAVGLYQSLPSGTSAVAVTVGGVALAPGSVNIAPGTDQTLLIYTADSGNSSVWLPDDNRLPAAATGAKLRLVHGQGGLSGALSLKANLLPVADNVALGSASAYGAVSTGTNVRITVNAVGTPSPVVDLADQLLEAGGVYTLFVVPGTAPAAGVLRRDR